MDFEGFRGRLIELIDEYANGRYTVFAKKMGIQPSTFQNYLKGGSWPNSAMIIQICENYGINADWLLFGMDPKYRHKRSLHELPEHSLSIITTPDQKAHWEALEDPRNFSVTPIISDIAAGPAVMVDDRDIDGYAVIYQDWHHEGDHVCFRVKGRSMEPVLSEGDIVGVNLSRKDPMELHNGIIAAYIDGGVTVKKLKMEKDYAYLTPINTLEFSPQAIDLKDLDQVIVGLVEWSWKRM